MSSLQVKVQKDSIQFFDPENESYNKTTISFQRTLRIPDDGKIYPLPPSLGTFPIMRVDDYLDKVPPKWKEHGGVFLPMYQREAMWIKFDVDVMNAPKAIKVAVGKVNAVTGEAWNNSLSKQDYVVAPLQPWLDGINSGGDDAMIRQFVAMPLGSGYTVEKQVTGKEEFGGIQIMVFESKNKPKKPELNVTPVYRFSTASHPQYTQSLPPSFAGSIQSVPTSVCSTSIMNDVPLNSDKISNNLFYQFPSSSSSQIMPKRSLHKEKSERACEMGLSAGGKMKQKIIEDSYGVDHWDTSCFARCYIHIVNSAMYEQITGQKPPATPISAKTYSSYGYPWYNLYEEDVSGVPTSNILANVKSVKEIDQEKFAWPQQDDSTVNISNNQVFTIGNKNAARDGDW